MKGKRTFKRFLAVLMAVAFTVTGITFTPDSSKEVKAATSFSGWTDRGDSNWNAYCASSGSCHK